MGKTSTDVKRRYNDKVYTHINIALPKELAEQFKAECERAGVSQASVIKQAIEKFLSRPE